MSNRVEQLEATVSELESTVRGLTEELVETKERLRALENELDVDAADFVEEPPEQPVREADPDDVREAASEAEPEPETESDEETTEESELGDDIIVA